MVHGQIHIIKTVLHQLIQPDCFFSRLQVSDKHRMINQSAPLQTQKSRQKSIRRRKRTDIYISTPGLLQDPSEQTESMKTFTKISLQRLIPEWYQKIRYLLSFLHHCFLCPEYYLLQIQDYYLL